MNLPPPYDASVDDEFIPKLLVLNESQQDAPTKTICRYLQRRTPLQAVPTKKNRCLFFLRHVNKTFGILMLLCGSIYGIDSVVHTDTVERKCQ